MPKWPYSFFALPNAALSQYGFELSDISVEPTAVTQGDAAMRSGTKSQSSLQQLMPLSPEAMTTSRESRRVQCRRSLHVCARAPHKQQFSSPSSSCTTGSRSKTKDPL